MFRESGRGVIERSFFIQIDVLHHVVPVKCFTSDHYDVDIVTFGEKRRESRRPTTGAKHPGPGCFAPVLGIILVSV